MKAVLQNMKTGELGVDEVAAPALACRRAAGSDAPVAGQPRDRTRHYRARQEGTHRKGTGPSRLFRKVLNKAKQEGYWNTYQVVKNLMASPIPLGYSCAGEVLGVGRDAAGFQVGDRVACAGLNYATMPK